MSHVEKCAQLLKVSPDAELAEIKQAYRQWREKFEAQMGSDNSEIARKGSRNLTLLEEAYQVLASHAVAAARRKTAETSATEPDPSPLPISIELGSCRVGFTINNIEGFQVHDRNFRQFRVNWPTGKVTFYNDRLKIGALIFSSELEYRDIEEIKRFLFLPMVFRIKHRSPNLGVNVTLLGPSLGRKLKALNKQHNLRLPLKY